MRIDIAHFLKSSTFSMLVWLTCASVRAQPATLVDNGSTVTLANGIVSLVIDKSNGRCTDLRAVNGPNLLANGGRIYFDSPGVGFLPELYTVITNDPGRVEIALTQTNFAGLHAELHYTLRSGDQGPYAFTVWKHGVGDPAVTHSQSRMVIRCDPGLFTRAYSFPDKTGQMIEPSLLSASPLIMDATYKLPLISSYTNETGFTHDGYPVYSKYDWSDTMENHRVHGVAGDAYGLWIVMGSVEYYNGGPTKAGQMVHGTETTPVILWVAQSGHFGGQPISLKEDESWSKLNGPYLIHVNQGTNADELWIEAQARAMQEQQAWPYAWMNHPEYPIDRGAIKGRLQVRGESTSNALLVLAQPGAYWHLQGGTNYQFWTRAEADGSFAIHHVRPGTYALQAHVPGIVGLMEKTGVVVHAGQTNDLEVIDWSPARYQRRLFRLGTPDLSTAEFRFGARMRQYGLWWRYLEEQGTNDLNFTVGLSVPSNDWYYALSILPIEITPTNGIWVSPRWNIHFPVSEIPPAPARLSIELAGAISDCAFYVFVNGINICPNPGPGIYTANDSGIYRSAVRASRQQRFEITFDPSLLVVGTNTVSFTVRATGSRGLPWSGERPVYPRAGIMFDCVQLEAGALVTNAAPRFLTVKHSPSQLILCGDGGWPDAMYHLLATTNLLTGSWQEMATNRFDAEGGFGATITASPSSPEMFYSIRLP